MSKIKVAFMRGGCPTSLLPMHEIIAGCSEIMEVKEPDKADILVVQFCALSQEAMLEWQKLRREVIGLQRRNPKIKILAGGCLHNMPEEWVEGAPEKPDLSFVDYKFGFNNMTEVFRAAITDLTKERIFSQEAAPYVSNGLAQILIEFGCNRRCSFCKTNYLHNMQVVSRPEAQIVDLARRAIEQGATGVALNAQNSTEYGYGMDGVDLVSLLQKVIAVPGVEYIDVAGVCLDEVDERILEALRHPKIRFIQIELQSLDDNIRRKMNLKKTRDEALAVLSALDGKVLSSNFIVGFPGCSPKEFDREMRYIRRYHLYYLALVTYDNTPGTPSYKMGTLPSKGELAYYVDRFISVVADEREVLLQKLLKEESIEAHVVAVEGDKVFLQALRYSVKVMAVASGKHLRVGERVNVKVMGLLNDLIEKQNKTTAKVVPEQLLKKQRYFDLSQPDQAMVLVGSVA